MFGGMVGAPGEHGLRQGMQVVGWIQFDQCSRLLKTAAQSCTRVAAAARAERDEAASCSKNSHRRPGDYHG